MDQLTLLAAFKDLEHRLFNLENSMVGLGNHVGELTTKIGKLELAAYQLVTLLAQLAEARGPSGSGDFRPPPGMIEG